MDVLDVAKTSCVYWAIQTPAFVSSRQSKETQINPFVPKVPFLELLKTSENRKVFWCFRGVEKGRIANKQIKTFWNHNAEQ